MAAETWGLSPPLPSKTVATTTTTTLQLSNKRMMIILIVTVILLFSINVIQNVPIVRKSAVASQYTKSMSLLELSEMAHNGNETMLDSNNCSLNEQQQQQYLSLKPLIQEHPTYKSINNALQQLSKSTTSSMVYLDEN